jgi:phosphatidylserine decarboxylase
MLKKRLLRISWSLIWLIVIILLRYKIFFLRLPNRVIIEDANVFLSPANGKIIAIITGANDPVVKNHRVVVENAMKDTWTGSTMVSIMMTPLNVHYQRAPQTSTLIAQTYKAGKFLNAMGSGLDATFENEYNAMLFETPAHSKFKVIQIAWFLARRIVSYLEVGQSVKQGDLLWLIRFGSQVTIIFDNTVNVKAKVGDTVDEGLTILGTLKK